VVSQPDSGVVGPDNRPAASPGDGDRWRTRLQWVSRVLDARIRAALAANTFWVVLIVGTIAGADLVVVRYTIVDEAFMAVAAFYAVAALGVHRWTLPRAFPEKLHLVLFIGVASFMLLQAVRGIVVLESPQKGRWVVFFGLLIILSVAMVNVRMSARRITVLIVGAGLLYGAVYLAMIFLEAYGISAVDLRPTRKAFTLFPLALGLTAAAAFARDPEARLAGIALALFAVAFWAALILESRMILLILIVTSAAAAWGNRPRRTVVGLAVFVLVFLIHATISGADNGALLAYVANDVGSTITGNTQILNVAHPSRDQDRVLHVMAGWDTIRGDPFHFLFGYGYRVGGFAVVPHLTHYFERYYADSRELDLLLNAGGAETEGLTTLLVDTGVVGLFGFLSVAAVTIVRCWAISGAAGRIAALGGGLVVGWLPVYNLLEVAAFWLAIMPGGLLIQLAKLGNPLDARHSWLRQVYWWAAGIRAKVFGSSFYERQWAKRGLDDVRKGLVNLYHPHRSWLVDGIVGLPSPDTVLEIGSGYGPNLLQLARRLPGVKCHGLDVNPYSISEGRRLASELALPNIELRVGSFKDLDALPESAVDYVLSDGVLMYVGPDRIMKALESMCRVARRGVVLLELNAASSTSEWTRDGWVRDYAKLLKQIMPLSHIEVRRVPPQIWPEGRWSELGVLVTATK
jgi:predicted O-methyltransferase YrrM